MSEWGRQNKAPEVLQEKSIHCALSPRGEELGKHVKLLLVTPSRAGTHRQSPLEGEDSCLRLIHPTWVLSSVCVRQREPGAENRNTGIMQIQP